MVDTLILHSFFFFTKIAWQRLLEKFHLTYLTEQLRGTVTSSVTCFTFPRTQRKTPRSNEIQSAHQK